MNQQKTLCGDCNTGCNVGAKNKVLMNYLPDAHTHGAEIFCQVEVQSIAPAGGSGGGGGWTAHCALVGTDAPSDPPLAFPDGPGGFLRLEWCYGWNGASTRRRASRPVGGAPRRQLRRGRVQLLAQLGRVGSVQPIP